nr:hypothetical protein [Gammaproteobacteria bacterium]
MSESRYVMRKRLAEVIAYSENLLQELAGRDAPEAVRMKSFLEKDVQEKRRLLIALWEQEADRRRASHRLS